MSHFELDQKLATKLRRKSGPCLHLVEGLGLRRKRKAAVWGISCGNKNKRTDEMTTD